MRFTCDSCGAQYMISDQKVGPNGVKVRCKKCSHIIVVKRAPAEVPAAPAPSPAAPPGGDGLDAELGKAFDKVLGDTPPAGNEVPTPPADAPPGPPETPAAAEGPASEWHVAIDDQQVGPLVAAAVKRKWEAGEIGPDSLVWKPGMEDWKPLSAVPDLAQVLAPIPRAAPLRVAPARPAAPEPAAAAARSEPDWKPSAASALAALASEELSSMKAPEPHRPAAAVLRPGNKGSLVDSMNLPDSGGVDPTGAIPLPIKGLESTGESKLERKSSIARSTAELRIRRSANRTILAVGALLLLVFGAAVAGVFWYFNQRLASTSPGTAAGEPSPAPPRVAPPAAPQPTAPQPTAPPPAAAAAPAPAPAAAAPAVARQAPRAETPRPTAAPTRRRASPSPQPERAAPQRVASAQPAPKGRKSSVDPFEPGGADDEFQKLLNEPSSRRSVYVPPPPGGALAEKVSPGQIQEAVAGKMGLLQDCLAKQQASDASAHGEVTVTWDIDSEGRPAAVSAGRASGQPFAQCLVGVVKSIRFPRSRSGNRGEDKVRFPFRY